MDVHSPQRMKSAPLGSLNGIGAFVEGTKVYAVSAPFEEMLNGVNDHSME